MSLRDFFYSKCERIPEAGCWVWTGCQHPDGYGQTTHKGRHHMAHRLSYELHIGPIPAGMCVCHRCDVPACVNPDHLFIGTRADNNQDKKDKGRGNHGERNGRARLTAAEVQAIRASTEPHVVLAARHGLHWKHISDIRARKKWRHVP